MGMKNNNEIILNKLMKNLNFYDIIIMKIFKSYTLKVYRLGFSDAFKWENQKHGKKLKNKNR